MASIVTVRVSITDDRRDPSIGQSNLRTRLGTEAKRGKPAHE